MGSLTPRRLGLIVLVAILGVAAAAGIGLAANAISGDAIGLSAEPLAAGDDLAPPAARATEDSAADEAGERRRQRQRQRLTLRVERAHRVDPPLQAARQPDHPRQRRRHLVQGIEA
jgi:hypothetical protein